MMAASSSAVSHVLGWSLLGRVVTCIECFLDGIESDAGGIVADDHLTNGLLDHHGLDPGPGPQILGDDVLGEGGAAAGCNVLWWAF
jgi:hypothetical protein